MEYLRKFNEFREEDEYDKYLDIENLQIMITNYLAYLKDDYNISIEDEEESVYIKIEKDNNFSSPYLTFNYSDVADMLSPFIVLLQEKYSTLSVFIECVNIRDRTTYNIEDLLNGDTSPENIEGIYLYIYPKTN